MKSIRVMLCVVFICVICSSAFAGLTPKTVVLDVFADSSLSGALEKIKNDYTVYHQVSLNFRFASSEELAELIREGSVCDVFIPAGSEHFNGINIIADSRINLAQKDGRTYYAAVLASARNEKPALRFTGYLTNNDAGLAFRAEGFSQVQAPLSKPVTSGAKSKKNKQK